jgi:Secretion system C-terminal sorting domain
MAFILLAFWTQMVGSLGGSASSCSTTVDRVLKPYPHEQALEQPTNKEDTRLNNTDLADLRSIAAQCPYSGGNAVFAARAMLAQQDRTYYNDKALCLEQGIMWRTSKPNKAKDNASNITWNVFIAPNPTNDKVTVSFSNKHPEGSIELYDLYGRLLETVVFGKDTNTNVLDISAYTAGVYIVKVKGNDSNNFTKKVVLIK